MKVLIFNETFYPALGGVETFISILSNYLHKIGEDITVITNTSSNNNLLPSHDYKVLRCPSKDIIREQIASSDIIHLNSFDPFIFLVSVLKRKKIITSYHDLSLICPKATKFKIDEPCLHSAGPFVCYKCLVNSNTESKLKKLIRPLIKACMSVFNDVSLIANEFQDSKFKLLNKRIVAYGVDLDLFKPPNIKKTNKRNTVLFIGRLVKEKGCAILIKAVKICIDEGMDIELLVIGPGPEKNKLLKLTQELDIQNNVRFLGSKYGQEIVEYLHNANMAVIPSLLEEVYGLVAVEAIACGVPVIASNVGGLGLIVNECGLTFERGNYKELADKIRYLWENPDLMEKISVKSRTVALRKYNSNIMCQNIYSLYYNLLNKRCNKNYSTYLLAKLIPFKYKRLIHVNMVNIGWPVRIKEGNESIEKLGYKDYVGSDRNYHSTGKIFLQHLLDMGLLPNDILCDIGCGSLRVGKHIINYLDEAKYLGLEKEGKLVELGLEYEIGDEAENDKKPEFVISSKFEFNLFSKIPNIAIALSLFSHLNQDDIKLCLKNLANLIKSEKASCKLLASYFNTDYPVANYRKSHSHLGFFYTKDDMINFGIVSGWEHELMEGWITPSGQKMIVYTINSESKIN